MGDEDNPLIRFRGRNNLAHRKPAVDPGPNTMSVDYLVEVGQNNIRAFPARATRRRSRIILWRRRGSRHTRRGHRSGRDIPGQPESR
jgi:hypothetical protein